MPSKGVDLYTFSTEEFYTGGVKTVFEVDGTFGTGTKIVEYPKLYPESYTYNKDHYEMNASYIRPSDILRLEIYKGNACVGKVSIQVSGQTGKISENEIMQFLQPSVVTNDFCFSCGLYYSDGGIMTNLPNAHQFYGVVTENQSRWMGSLFKSIGNKYNTIRLSDLIIPGSHDAGMYTSQPSHFIEAYANTQKDTISTQLALGSRIFDFRPGKLTDGWTSRLISSKVSEPWNTLINYIGSTVIEKKYKPYLNDIRHIHACIPGASYRETVAQIIDFLDKNTQEIVIINAVSNGILDGIEVTQKKELDTILYTVIAQRGSSLKVGNKESLKTSVKELIESNQRLIVIGNYQVVGGEAVNYDGSYSDENYQSLNSNNVLQSLNSLNQKNWISYDLIEMSLQLTGTAVDGVWKRVVSGNYQANSPLFATKAATDMLTYSWIHAGNIKKLENSPLVAVYNDFYDPGLTAAVIVANKKRLEVK